MIIVIEPNLQEIKIWEFDDKKKEPVFTVKSIDELKDKKALKFKKPEAISFKIMFGADFFQKPARVDEAFFEKLKKIAPAFPFYIPFVENLIKSFYETYKDVPIYAFFETSFFSRLPEEEKYYAIPSEYFQKTNIKRTGYNGILHEHNASVFNQHEKIVSVVLDKQTTVCAINKGRPMSISLGYTPLEGIMGRTSVGDLDPGIVFYLMKRYKLSIYKIDDILKKESGFFGLTGYDLNIDELFSFYGKDEKVDFAFLVYQNQILKYIGEGISSLAGLDAIVFSGCYAKTLAPVIHNIIKSISFLGITLKMLPWEKNINEISADDSKIKAYLNATSLPQVIFEETKKIL